MKSTSTMRLAPCGVALFSVLIAGGCASTSVEGSWLRPDFTERPIAGPVFVVGVARDEVVRRTYEDEMAARLGASGVAVVRSYEQVPGRLDAQTDERLMAAARAAGARYLLSTALIGEHVDQVVTETPAAGGYRRWYGTYWGMSYARTEVRTIHVYTAQTSLVALADDGVVWTVRTRTSDPSEIEAETRALVGVLVEAMTESGLVADVENS